MHIPKEVVEELKSIKPQGLICEPSQTFLAGHISRLTMSVIKTNSDQVFISKVALKHIVDSRKDLAERVIEIIPEVLKDPDKIADNSVKRHNSFLFAKKLNKHYGVILEITKTTGLVNQVVSAFVISRKTYGKIRDISGGTAATQ